jgi:outer membrane lipoprotein-sorting protein
MKTLSLLVLAIFFLSSCSQLRLQKEEAASAIRAAKNYPRVYEYEINMTDPASAKKLLDAGLEGEGWITVDKTQKLKDAGQPIVHFTEKAKPYLIRIDEKYDNVQVVKAADMDLGQVTGVQLQDDNKNATVEYTVVYKNMTPFAKLMKRDLSEKETERASLSYFDSGWKMDSKR